MASAPDRTSLDGTEQQRLSGLRSAGSLTDLVELTDAASEEEAYHLAKREWNALHGRQLFPGQSSGFPGACVTIDGCEFWVHGITHAGTAEERAFVREHVSTFLEDGAAVYCEQGIRPLYLSDVDGVCAMDDYRWASRQCSTIDRPKFDAELSSESMFAGLRADVTALATRFRDGLFSLIDQGGELYGEAGTLLLGRLASSLLTGREDLATGTDFESYRLRKRATRDPTTLADLQAYYTRQFLPQPVEREWLRRHDPDLERVTHARNQRMAEYVMYHTETAREVHMLVGAAHQPGIVYYLEQFRDGKRRLGEFVPCE
jgi:hypothetical protein